MTRACMGGWCRVRENCANYLQPFRYPPVERACRPGVIDQYRPTGYPVFAIVQAPQ